MNKTVNHRTQSKKVVILLNSNRNVIGYSLVTFTPKVKRVLESNFTEDRKEAKKFLQV